MMNQQFGLLGKQLGHSMSPLIQSYFGVSSYDLIPKEEDELAALFADFPYQGINVTIPYKKAVIPFLDDLDPVAHETGSVNCIVVRNGKRVGYNTDAYGFHFMLRQSPVTVYHKVCTIIGTGGVSMPIARILDQENAKEIRFLSHQDNTPEGLAKLRNTEILVNASPVGMYPNTEESPVPLKSFPFLEGVLDVIANPYRTRLIQEAEKRKIPCCGGLPMLVAQAKASAELFLQHSISDARMKDILSDVTHDMLNVVLIGMPGSGKTTAGQKVAELLERPFFDSDQEVVKRAGMPIPDIFRTQGEEGFRKLETEVLRDLASRTGIVLSTGGGCVTRQENHPLLRQNGFCVYLDTPLEQLSMKNRPLSTDRFALLRLFQSRNNLYHELAHVVVKRQDTKDDTASLIIKEFKGF